MYWCDGSGRLELTITLADAQSASHSGRCDDDVAALRHKPSIRRQLAKWDAAEVRAALKEYGCWEADELADHETNLDRMLWLACCDVKEEAASKAVR